MPNANRSEELSLEDIAEEYSFERWPGGLQPAHSRADERSSWSARPS